MKSSKQRIMIFTLLITMLFSMTPTLSHAGASPVKVMTSTTGQNAGTDTLALSKPESLQSGELLVAQIVYGKGIDAIPITAPAGWTLILQNHADTTTGSKSLGQALFYKIAGTDEPGTYTWRFSQKVNAMGGITRFSGASTTQPILAFGGQSGNSATTELNQLTAPSLSCIRGSQLVSFYSIKALAVLYIPKEMDGVYNLNDMALDLSLMASHENVEDTGSTTSRSSHSWNNDKQYLALGSEWIAQMIAIKPATVTTLAAPPVGSVIPSEITVYVNDVPLNLTDKPVLDAGRTLVPMRALFEALGAEVYWDSVTRTALGILNSTEVKITIGSNQPTVNGWKQDLDVPARIISNRTYIPLRFVSEAFGGQVYWEPSTKTIYIQR